MFSFFFYFKYFSVVQKEINRFPHLMRNNIQFSVCFFSKRTFCRDEHHCIIKLKQTLFLYCCGFQPQHSSFFSVAMTVWRLEPCGLLFYTRWGEEIRDSHFWEGTGHVFQKKSAIMGSFTILFMAVPCQFRFGEQFLYVNHPNFVYFCY